MRINGIAKAKKYTIPTVIYVIFCIILLLLAGITINRLVRQSNINQADYILNLMADKVNTSFDMMTGYIEEMADYISTKDNISFDECYFELQQIVSERPYFSIGMIDNDGNVYGNTGEKIDMEKHNYVSVAATVKSTYITEPYRSCVTGSNMITMFSPIYNKGKHIGSIFMSYHLETVQSLAYAKELSKNIAVFLINPYSGNFVTCYSGENTSPGIWSNIRLVNEITNLGRYNSWIEAMKNNNLNENIININREGIDYAQAFVSINGMKNWYIVIRIPLNELSVIMKQYTVSVAVFTSLFIVATIIFAIIIFIGEYKQKQKLKNLSDIDMLTKVINRRGFHDKVDKYFAGKSENDKFTFMFIDIDYFKSVNDTYGHSAGDDVLCCVASVLVDVFSQTAIVARIGGDEFNVFVYKPLSVEEIDGLMADVRIELKNIITRNGQAVPVTFSAGLSVFPDDASDIKTLIECADKALYNVKKNGRNNHCWYDDIKENRSVKK